MSENLFVHINRPLFSWPLHSSKHNSSRRTTSSSVSTNGATVQRDMESSVSSEQDEVLKNTSIVDNNDAFGNPNIDAESHNELRPIECLQAYDYISKIPGKNVRSMLLDALLEFPCFKAKTEIRIQNDIEVSLRSQIDGIRDVIGMLHNASLMVDDIEDDSTLRRGHACAHLVFGNARTLNAANYVYFIALNRLLELAKVKSGIDNDLIAKVSRLFCDELMKLHRGQGLEIFWREEFKCPTMDEYTEMIIDKTGGLFRLATSLMMVFIWSSAELEENIREVDALANLVNLMSIYFQVRDDFINLANSSFFEKKSFCEDFSEGKFSFVIIHALSVLPDSAPRNKLLEILKTRPKEAVGDKELKTIAVKILKEESKSFSYTKQYLDEVRNMIYSVINDLGGNDKIVKMMKILEKEVDDCDI